MRIDEPATGFPLEDRFELVGELGRGGMGVVYEVRDRDRAVRLALKGVRDLSPREILRLKSEFRALRDLRHPNLVRLGELFERHGTWFFTMELVDGVDLLQWVRPGPPAEDPETSALSDGSATRTGLFGHDELVAVGLPLAPEPTEGVTRTVVEEIAARRAEALRRARGPGGGSATLVDGPVTDPDPAAMSGDPDRPHQRLGAAVDLPRLRDALRGLAAGIAALHRAGIVHRDIKPNNVLVGPDGRVVLLDFGVAAAVDTLDREPADEVVGTYGYMAPEQALNSEVGPAADWYAVGVVLFEALTGRRPFPRGRRAIRAKLAGPAPSVRHFAPDAPADLADLCDALLQADPADRPVEATILAVLAVGDDELSDSGDWAGAGRFVGRDRELATLTAAYAGAGGRAACALLAGESGIGKTAVMRRFVERLRADDPSVLVLAGRCDQREVVPYNAFDRVVDDLARWLGRLPPGELQVPGGCSALVRLFPVLRGVAGLDRPEAPADGVLDQRTIAFAALIDLIAFAAARHRVVIVIDDLHWADRDSLAFLSELMSGPDAPPVFMVATARPGPGRTAAAEAIRVPTRTIDLAGLLPDDARRLLAALSPGAADADAAAQVVAETAGHPMFLAEMARHLSRAATGARLDLDDAIAQRIAGLPDDARRLLEIASLAGAALELGAAAEAAAVAPDRFLDHLAGLREARLVRLTGTRDRDAIEPYHDRVREIVATRMAPPRRAEVHAALARALEARDAPAEVLAYHLAEAGARTRAAAFAEAAARRAIASLAFERAATWLRTALTLGDLEPGRRRILLADLGEMLARAGHTADAGRAFVEAAGTGEPHVDEQRELRRRAAEQFLIGGHLEEGLATTRALVKEVGLALPEGTTGAIARLVWYQTRLGLSRLRWKARPPAELDARGRFLVDLCWSLSCGLSLVDTTRGAVFALRGPLLALPVGDPMRTARALGAASMGAAAMGRARVAARLLEGSRRAAEASADEMGAIYPALGEMTYRFFIENDWPAALAVCEQAVGRWRDDGRGHAFEIDILEQHRLWSLNNLGAFGELRRVVPPAIRAARRTGNRFLEVILRTYFPIIHLLRDRIDEARADVADAIASWQPDQGAIANPFYFATRSRTMITLYSGRPEDGAEQLERDWRRVDRSPFPHVPVVRVERAVLRCNWALARSVAADARGEPSVARGHRAEAARWLRRLRKVSLPLTAVARAQLEAGLARARGDDDATVAHLRAAMVVMDAQHMSAQAATTRWRLGGMVGGDEGAALRRDAQAYFDAQGAVHNERSCALVYGGWPLPA